MTNDLHLDFHPAQPDRTDRSGRRVAAKTEGRAIDIRLGIGLAGIALAVSQIGSAELAHEPIEVQRARYLTREALCPEALGGQLSHLGNSRL